MENSTSFSDTGSTRKPRFFTTPAISPDMLPEAYWEAFVERAAIMQHDGGMTQEQAEEAALNELLGRLAAEVEQ